jgi:hypothetical protein
MSECELAVATRAAGVSGRLSPESHIMLIALRKHGLITGKTPLDRHFFVCPSATDAFQQQAWGNGILRGNGCSHNVFPRFRTLERS